jgi:hypothetical protein
MFHSVEAKQNKRIFFGTEDSGEQTEIAGTGGNKKAAENKRKGVDKREWGNKRE